MQASRRRIVDLEDEVTDVKARVTEMAHEVSSASQREKEAMAKVEKRDEQVAQLKVGPAPRPTGTLAPPLWLTHFPQRDNATLQQSLRTAQSSRQGSHGGSYAGGGAALGEVAALEAQVQQVRQELELSRVQLQAERDAKQQLSTSLEGASRTTQDLRAQLRAAQAEAEDRVAEALQEQEQQYQDAMQEPQQEVTSLKDKVQSLQLSLTDMGRDVQLARKKESAARMEIDRLRRAREGARSYGNASPLCR